MKMSEYLKVKDMNYGEYCDYLQKKYGMVKYMYGNPKNNRSAEGLCIHHIREDEVPALSESNNRKKYPQYQQPNELVYCDLLEHLLLHIFIGETTIGSKNLGLGGAFTWLIPELRDYFGYGKKSKTKNEAYYRIIDKDIDVYNCLFDRYNNVISNREIVLEQNAILYVQMENYLDEQGKALLVLGTGLGKTTTALQYIFKHNVKALVIVPNKLIKSSWENYGEYCDVTTYPAFAKNFKAIDYSKYGLVILDEAHHLGYNEKDDKGAKVWVKGIKHILDNKIIKVLGLTATPERADKIDVGVSLFEDCICEGMSVEDGIRAGIIYPFSYITALYNTEGIVKQMKENGEFDRITPELQGQLDLALNNTLTLNDIFKKYLLNNNLTKNIKRKGIVFIQCIEDETYVKSILCNVFVDIEMRTIHSNMSASDVKKNRKWFEDTDEGFLLAVNMISEGAHYKGVNTLIMFRKTNSYPLYCQQLGRIITLTKDTDPNGIVFDLVNNIDNIRIQGMKIEHATKRRDIDNIRDALAEIARELERRKSKQIIVADESKDIVNALMKLKRINADAWTEEDDNILKEVFPKEGIHKCMELFPNKNRNQLEQRIYMKLKLKRINADASRIV